MADGDRWSTPSTEELRLLGPVLAAPDDDSPRLDFAVWCDSQKDLRGEFIRLQLRAAKKNDSLDSQAAHAHWRAMDLLNDHGESWMRSIRPYARGAQYYRGFVALISNTAQQFLRDADALFRLAPIQHLDIVAPLDCSVEMLLASPHLKKLRGLSLRGARIGDQGARRLAATESLAELRFLDLGINDIGAAGTTALIESPYLTKLAIVHFDGNHVNLAYTIGIDQGAVVDSQPSAAAAALIAKYGPRLWLNHVDGDRFTVATWSAAY